jgi:hypothetical protein
MTASIGPFSSAIRRSSVAFCRHLDDSDSISDDKNRACGVFPFSDADRMSAQKFFVENVD